MTLQWGDREIAERAGLLGPGAPFELADEDVLGQRLEVFVKRPRSLTQLLQAGASRHGDLPYLIEPAGITVSFAAAVARVRIIAGSLATLSVGPGDRVAIAAANSLEHALAAWAVLWRGAVVVGLNGWWAAPELAHGLSLTKPHLVLCDAARVERLEAAGAAPIQLADLASRAAEPVEALPVAEDDPAVIMFTSGTTARPKAAVLSHRALIAMGQAATLGGATQAIASGAARPAGQPKTLWVAPAFHVSGLTTLLVLPPLVGTALVITPPGKWDPERHLALSESYGLTSWNGVPTQYWRLLRSKSFAATDLSALQTLGTGGAPLDPELLRAVAAALPHVRVTNGYGMTETCGAATSAWARAERTPPACVGTPWPTVAVQVRGPDGVEVPDGEHGEIHVRGPNVFLGYLDDAAATSAAISEDRWYRTGDGGCISGGQLVLTARLSELVIRGGENIAPVEVENRLREHPLVLDAAVGGVPDAELGQLVKAWVVAAGPLAESELQSWAAAGLAAYKVPASIEFRETLPYNDTGKVLRRVLESGG